MIKRAAHAMARGASLAVTDRRWGVTLSAAALGFGLFVGVAIGPGAAGTFAGPQQLIALPALGAGDDGEVAAVDAGGGGGSLAGSTVPLGGDGKSSSLESFPAAIPLASESSEPLPAVEETAPESTPPAGEEEGEAAGLETTALAGTVVHANPAAGSYTLAIKGGELVPVHAAKLPPVGAKLSLEGLQLANGTFAEEGKPKRDGRSAKASFRGAVTHVAADPAAPAYTLSGRGASILVHVRPDATGALPPLPQLGAYATATVSIEKPQPEAAAAETPPATPAPACAPDPSLPPAKPPTAILWQQQLKVEEGEPATYLDLSGVVTAVCPESAQLLISADDMRESSEHLTLAVPPQLDASRLKPGDSLLATANLGEDGTVTLAGLASDEQRKGADDARSAQGDLKR